MPLFFAAGFAAAWLFGRNAGRRRRRPVSSILLFGVFVRTVLVWHITWAINSVTHLWGYRNYETDEDSRNNLVVGLISNGEGWHNNHHADPRSARHGHQLVGDRQHLADIRFLAFVGLANDVVAPSAHLAKHATGSKLMTRGSHGRA